MTTKELVAKALEEAEQALRANLEGKAVAPAQIEHAIELAEQARMELSGEPKWIGVTEAQRMLGLGSDHTVRAWAERGLIKSSRQLNGYLRIDRADVERKVALMTGLASDDDEMSSEELSTSFSTRNRGAAPWEGRGAS